VKVRNASHDLGVRLSIVLGRLAVWEGGGCDEVRVVVTKMLYHLAPFVFLRRVCQTHVLFHYVDVLLCGY
jgi:hypothetical protein